jgi:serine/threonine-protein kinase RsbW
VNNADGPIVGLLTESRPQTLTIVRGMLSAVAELLEMDPELLDDLKTSVSEACNNVVLHAYGDVHGPMEVRLYANEDEIRVVVGDAGVGLGNAPDAVHGSQGIGVSVIQALARDAHFQSRPDGGTEVSMAFDAERDGRRLFTAPGPAAGDVGRSAVSDGEIELTISPVALIPAVLGRLARTLAASAHFSLDRFSDVYLVTDTLAAHATRAASAGRIVARMSAAERRLEIGLGPFRPGTGEILRPVEADRLRSPLALLADEITVREDEAGEFVDVVVVDPRR